MSRAARQRRWRMVAAISSAFALAAGLLVAISVAGGARHAAANPIGVSPIVYISGTNGNGGLVDAFSLSAVRNGAAGSTGIGGIPPGTFVRSLAVNVTATTGVIGTDTGESSAVAAFDVKTGAISGTAVPVNSSPIGLAVDPANAGVAFALLQSGEVDQVQIGSSATPIVTSLPSDAGDQLRVAPDSIAVSPDGATVYVGWGDRGGFGVDAISVPLPHTVSQWSRLALNFPRVPDLAVAPDGHHVFAVETDGFTTSTAFALTAPNLPPTASPPTWATALQSIPAATPLRNARAITVSPDGQTVIVGGTSGNSGSSAVMSLAAGNGNLQVSQPLAMTTNDDGVGGLTGMSVSPDGHTLVAAGFDNVTNRMRLFPLSPPSLQVVGAPTTLSIGTDGPQDIAMTPDQAPVAAFSGPAAVQVDQGVTFDATASQVTFGSITSFAWDFGDGTTAGPSSSALVGHTYNAPGTYQVTLTEVDSAGAGFAPTPSPSGPGQTPYRLSGPSARTTGTITVTPAPPTNTTTTAPSTTTTGPGQTTTTTVPGQHAPGPPTLVLNPAVGAPGTIVTVTGTGFQPNTPVTVAWTVSTGSVVIVADNNGNLPPSSLLILTPDVLGPRFAQASSTPQASAPFLVVPSTSEPGGDDAGLLFRSEGP